MKNFLLLVLVLGLSLSARAQGAAGAHAPGPRVRSVTLYSLNRHKNYESAFLDFKAGTLGRSGDLNYGALEVGEEHDWFQVSLARNDRTAFRDLGPHDWSDSFAVPFVEPFPKLKAGEQRTVAVDASGADGEDGPDGADAADADGVVRPHPRPPRPERQRGPRHDGVPKVDPVFAKAVVGHMYVIRVVDDADDFYVLFRVESLERGDRCNITWKRVPPPRAGAAGKS